MITVNQIYTYIEGAVNTEQRPVYCASQNEPKPSEFPACYITEAQHRKDRRYVTLAFDDTHYIRDFQVQVFSNKQSGALLECHSIMKDAETAFHSIGFIETYCGEQRNIDPSVTRLVARFTRTIGGADTLPTTTPSESESDGE